LSYDALKFCCGGGGGDHPALVIIQRTGTVVSGVTLPSRASAVPTLAYTNTNIDGGCQDQPGLFQDDQWQDVFIPVFIEDSPLNSDENPSTASRKRRKIPSVWAELHPSHMETSRILRNVVTAMSNKSLTLL
jgi:hypothetical protein